MEIEYKHMSDTDLKQNKDAFLNQIVVLSALWDKEKSHPSYEANEASYYLNKEVYVATYQQEIIAYALGEIKVLSEATSYNKIGERAFELDELYVLESFRNKKVGKNLFQFVEASLKGTVDVIGVIATSFRYEDLLRFYIDDLGMSFNHALLVKRT